MAGCPNPEIVSHKTSVAPPFWVDVKRSFTWGNESLPACPPMRAWLRDKMLAAADKWGIHGPTESEKHARPVPRRVDYRLGGVRECSGKNENPDHEHYVRITRPFGESTDPLSQRSAGHSNRIDTRYQESR